jgi:hypothetical protein
MRESCRIFPMAEMRARFNEEYLTRGICMCEHMMYVCLG